jgi:hypothetical protein
LTEQNPEQTDLMHVTTARRTALSRNFPLPIEVPVGSKKLENFQECISVFFEHIYRGLSPFLTQKKPRFLEFS